MNPTPLYPGMVLTPLGKGSAISTLSRILEVRASENRVLLIHVEPKRSGGRVYFTGAFSRPFDIIQRQLDPRRPQIAVTTVKPRADATATAAELDKKYRRRDQKQSYPRHERRRRWQLILPLIKEEQGRLLFDEQLRSEAILRRAREIARDPGDRKQIDRCRRRILDALNQYWAGGSTRGALTPFTSTCGARGKTKTYTTKAGRRNNQTLKGIPGVAGFIATPQDQDIIQFCWRNYYISKTTEAKALRKMWREFYSIWETDDSGRMHCKLLPIPQRPTAAQFRIWGQKQSPNQASWRKQLSKSIARMMDRAMLGSANDGVYAVGQRGAIDSTSPDMKFASTLCRIDRIGPAYRILIVDALHGYIPGFYLGLEPPSAETVKLAILHAMTPKGPWLNWLGLKDQDLANWIPIHFTSFIADNTDARCETVFVSLDAIGSGSIHVPVSRSDLNSLVEVGHHQLHRLVDHNLHGTTQGQHRKERGEESADDTARHTILEAIRETARAIYAHNTMPLEIEPTAEMRQELLDKGVPITRASLTALAIRQNRVARALMDTDEARTHLMPPIRGTFTKKGVVLLRPSSGHQRKFIKSVTYISTHKTMLCKFRDASLHRGGRDIEKFDDDFRYDPYNPTEIHYRDPHTGELISLIGTSKDRELFNDCVHADIIARQDQHDIERPERQEQRDQILSDMELHQERTKDEAEDEYKADLAALPKKPSKAKLVANKTENREREKGFYFHGMPTPLSQADEKNDAPATDDAISDEGSPSPQAPQSPVHSTGETPQRRQMPTKTPPRSIFTELVANQIQ